MSRLFWLTEDQVERISPFFPKERGVGRANDRKVLSGIIYVIKNGLQWADAPIEYGPHKTLYNRFRRWSENGVFERIFEELAKPQDDAGSVLMIDATHLKAHRHLGNFKLRRFLIVWPTSAAGQSCQDGLCSAVRASISLKLIDSPQPQASATLGLLNLNPDSNSDVS